MNLQNRLLRQPLTFLACSAALISVMACQVKDKQNMPAETGVGADESAAVVVHDTTVNTFAYGCDNNYQFLARVGQDSTWLTLPGGRSVTVPIAISASGARYTDGTVTYWSKGDSAIFEVGDTSYAHCAVMEFGVPWVEAKLRGVTARAVGQEPGWRAEITRGKEIDFLGDYGDIQFKTGVPTEESIPKKGTTPATTVYTATSGTHRLTIKWEDIPCSDAMSGEKFSATVTATLDGKQYGGCGRML